MTRLININGLKWRITLTDHVIQRILKRNIPAEEILSSIISMINNNNSSRLYKDVMLKNLLHDFSLVLSITGNHIRLITAIDKGKNCKCNPGTLEIAI